MMSAISRQPVSRWLRVVTCGNANGAAAAMVGLTRGHSDDAEAHCQSSHRGKGRIAAQLRLDPIAGESEPEHILWGPSWSLEPLFGPADRKSPKQQTPMYRETNASRHTRLVPQRRCLYW